MDVVAVEAITNSPCFLSFSPFDGNVTSRRVALPSQFSLDAMELSVDTFIGQVATARIVSGKKTIILTRRKNASAAK